jgi:hypothetical protein
MQRILCGGCGGCGRSGGSGAQVGPASVAQNMLRVLNNGADSRWAVD